MKKTYSITTLALTAAMMAGSSQAATVTTQVLVNFDGAIAGNAYTLGAGEVDTTSTFAGFGNPTVSGGQADLAGAGTAVQGFVFNPTSLGSLSTQNWIAETIVSFDVLDASSTVISVQGNADFRVSPSGADLQVTYWDGGTSGSLIEPLPSTNATIHMALVWDATATSLTGYLDGVSIGTIDNGALTNDHPTVSFGYFARFGDRPVNGQLDAVAFSTFTGTFDASQNFAIPEPSSTALVGLAGLSLMLRRRR
jgi:hypothetical protein